MVRRGLATTLVEEDIDGLLVGSGVGAAGGSGRVDAGVSRLPGPIPEGHYPEGTIRHHPFLGRCGVQPDSRPTESLARLEIGTGKTNAKKLN